MAWLFAIPIISFIVLLVVGAITGRVKVQSCCTVADPRCDTRMRAAYDVAQTDVGASRS